MFEPDDLSKYDLEVGKRLTVFRHSAGMTQSAAANAAGISQSSLSLIEKGKRSVSGITVLRLARLYNASIGDILGETEGEKITPPAAGEAETILLGLVSDPDLADINESVSAYTAVIAYRLFRTLYECNPHNSSGIFSLSSKEAEDLTARFLKEESQKIASAASSKKAAVRSRIELPAEYSARVRKFIDTCEKLLTKTDDSDAPENI